CLDIIVFAEFALTFSASFANAKIEKFLATEILKLSIPRLKPVFSSGSYKSAKLTKILDRIDKKNQFVSKPNANDERDKYQISRLYLKRYESYVINSSLKLAENIIPEETEN
uniref:Uncharacterized protein n=1 Tax=Onchocerca volvulus TaxID=6282 RepID=A0A8R1XRU9_ONCVO